MSLFRKYLVDTNTLISKKRTLRNLNGYQNIFVLKCVKNEFIDNEFPTTVQVLEEEYGLYSELNDVFCKADECQSALIDLFKIQGGCDPLLIAFILHTQKRESETLFSTDWVLVTQDKAVIKVSQAFEIETLTPDEFLKEIQEM